MAGHMSQSTGHWCEARWCPAEDVSVDWAATHTGAAATNTPQQLGQWLPEPLTSLPARSQQ